MRRALRFAILFGVVASAAGSGCSVSRERGSASTYDDTIAPLIALRCASCHEVSSPAGGWSASTFIEAVSCVGDDQAPILTALSDATHAALVSASERKTLEDWVRAGSPKFRGTAHAPSFVDPRSSESHGRVLRRTKWIAMLDPNSAEACGRCHEGAPSRPAGVVTTAPGAPACTTCHTEPGGALGCNTCHGQGAGTTTPPRIYPPRDPCFSPGDSALSTAHAAHVETGATHAVGLPCSTCHPAPGVPTIGGTHGNGTVDVILDGFDGATKTCTTSCHARGGARPKPAWTEKAPLTCGDCHASPPAGHFEGACTGCHRESNATGTAFLTKPLLHVNGKVDLGDGSGKCGACHGTADDPWPSTNAHPGHRVPVAANGVPCDSCHVVPATFGPGSGHPRGGVATVALAGLATKRGTTATYAAGSCRDVYCHGGGLEGTVAATPAWTDRSGSARACGACHATPPPGPHPAATACDLCHRDGATGSEIAPAWTALHVNGVVDRR